MRGILFSSVLFLFIIVNFQISYGQNVEEGQLITADGDTSTIYFLHDRFHFNSSRFKYFKKQNGAGKVKIGPEKFISFTSNERYIVNIEIKEKGRKQNVLAEQILIGYYKLYRTNDKFNNMEFIIQDDSGVYTKLDQTTFQETLSKMGIYDCQEKKVKDKPLYIGSYFENVISSFNACKKPGKYVALNNKPKPKSMLGIKVGVNTYSIEKSNTFSQPTSANNLAYNLGVFLDVYKRTDFGLRIELSYFNVNTSTDVSVQKLTYFSLPVLAKINLLQKKNLGVLVGASTNLFSIKNPDIRSSSNTDHKLKFGYVVGLNYGFYFNNGRRINLDARINSNIVDYEPEINVNSISNTRYQSLFHFSVEIPLMYGN